MAVNVKALNQPYLYNYKYDQLNRLIAMDAYTGLNETNNTWAAIAITNKFKERVSYDANGNIKTYVRHHEFENAPMDDLTYYYTAGTNKLTHVKEGPNSQSWINGTKDIEDQMAGNYDYDEIGNLIKDASENIAPNGIQWNVYGKIASIERTAASNTSNAKKVIYDYDAAGNRIGKKVIKFGSARVEHTWYVRDATGNMLGVYTAGMDTTVSTTLSNFALLHTESYLYGSSKLGVLNRMEDVEGTNYNGAMSTTWRGSKHFELSNHLGNVMAVISDKKLPIADPNNATLIAGYDAEAVSANDYYPFGMTSRSYNNGYGNYRASFNNKEDDKDAGEGIQDYGMRIYDKRLGKFLSVDPIFQKYPWYTPYQFAGNKPIIAVDLDGAEELIRINFYNEQSKNNTAVFIPLSTTETGKVFTDVWADINGISSARNWASGNKDRFSSSNAVMDQFQFSDYSVGNFLKDYSSYKAPFTGQLTIDVNKPGSKFTYNLSYTRGIVKDDLYAKYSGNYTIVKLFEAGYLVSAGASNVGSAFTHLGTVASVTVGPEAGLPLIAGGTTLSRLGGGSEIGLDYLRGDNSSANQKLFIFGFSTIFDIGLGKAGSLAPSQKQKLDVIGTTFGDGTEVIGNQIKSNPTDSPTPRKADYLQQALEILRSI